jgi:hypothetical protein
VCEGECLKEKKVIWLEEVSIIPCFVSLLFCCLVVVMS